MARIGLIDVDVKGFPNIPLMKLSAWHKSKGDLVEWYEPMFSGHFDRVYLSKVFSFTNDYQYPINADVVIRGVIGIDPGANGGIAIYIPGQICALDEDFILKLHDEPCGYVTQAHPLHP